MTGEDTHTAGAEAVEVHDASERGRYELTVDGQLAGVAFYSRGDGEIVLKHTEVDAAFEGRGLGSRLARHVLDEARERGLRVVPLCPFMAGYIRTHPGYRDLVAEAAPDGGAGATR